MAPNWALFYFKCYGDETYIKLKLITSTFTRWSPNFWFGAQLGTFFNFKCYGDETYIKLKLITSTFTWWSPNIWFGAQLGAFLFYMLWEWDIHQIKANNKYFHMVVTKFLIWRPIGCFFILHAMGMRHTSN